MDTANSTSRFPRFLKGSEAAALSRLLANSMRTSVKIKSNGASVRFRFALDVPDEIQRAYPQLVDLLFAPNHRWSGFLQNAFEKSVSGGRSFHQSVHNLLRLVYIDALKFWLEESYMSGEQEIELAMQLQEFRNFAPERRRGQHPDPLIALRIAKRVPQLTAALRRVRQFVKGFSTPTAEAIQEKLGSALSIETLTTAIQKVDADPTRSLVAKLRSRSITNQELLLACLEAEVTGLVFGKRKPAYNSYLRLGKRLIDALPHDA
jgi:hypothetical protein